MVSVMQYVLTQSVCNNCFIFKCSPRLLYACSNLRMLMYNVISFVHYIAFFYCSYPVYTFDYIITEKHFYCTYLIHIFESIITKQLGKSQASKCSQAVLDLAILGVEYIYHVQCCMCLMLICG